MLIVRSPHQERSLSSSQPPGRAALKANPKTANAQSTPVQFSGNTAISKLTGSLVPVFKNINENYLTGFIVQDLLAVVLARIVTSLKTGREIYDPGQDPDYKTLTPSQQRAKTVKKNLQGLNWVNFREETTREIGTGPALLVLPGVLFGLNRLLGNRSREMSFSSLKNMGEGFSAYIRQSPPPHDREAYQKLVAHYLRDILVDPGLKHDTVTHKALLTLGQQYANLLLHQRTHAPKRGLFDIVRKHETTPLERVSEKLQETLSTFNDEFRLAPYSGLHDNPAFKNMNPLSDRKKTWVSYNPKHFNQSNTGHTQKEIQALTSDIQKMGDYFHGVWQQFEQGNRKHSLADIAEFSMKKQVVGKYTLGILTTVASATYLFSLAFWSQKSKTYQATRLLNPASNNNTQKQSLASKSPEASQKTESLQKSISEFPSSSSVNKSITINTALFPKKTEFYAVDPIYQIPSPLKAQIAAMPSQTERWRR